MQQKSVRSSSESYFWPTVWAVTIHVLLFAMLFVSFHFAPELPPAKPIVVNPRPAPTTAPTQFRQPPTYRPPTTQPRAPIGIAPRPIVGPLGGIASDNRFQRQ